MAAGPRRTCVACRTTRDKPDLLRVARSREGAEFDPGYERPGRGAYICRDEGCVRQAFRTGALVRALRLETRDLATLRDEIEEVVKR